jgi:butyrate kinase
MEKTKRILVLNLGSTSTKVAVYEDEKPVWTESVGHAPDDLKQCGAIVDQ